MAESPVAALYADGSTAGANPSRVGGTWCWCWVDERGRRLRTESGAVRPRDIGLEKVTNNFTELLAVVRGLESLPDSWCGVVYTDSSVTAGRVKPQRKTPSLNGIPEDLRDRLRAVKARMGRYKVVLLAGHPTAGELRLGRNRKGVPVSEHNVHCDDVCWRQAFDTFG